MVVEGIGIEMVIVLTVIEARGIVEIAVVMDMSHRLGGVCTYTPSFTTFKFT